jgi:hypothetical protein
MTTRRPTGLPRLIVLALVVAAGGVSLAWTWAIVTNKQLGVDLLIPLQAADRWTAGGQPYLGSAFAANVGHDYPFLYPPFTLPFWAALAALPRVPLTIAWVLLGLGAAVLAARRLGLRGTLVLALVWPPFSEGIWNGNVEILLFFCFVAAWTSSPFGEGLGTGLIAAIKPSQVQPWLLSFRRHARAAIVAAAILGLIALATLPITGLAIYGDWLAQVRAAADPNWWGQDAALSRFVGSQIAVIITIGSMLLVLALPRLVSPDRAPAWTGLLLLPAQLNLHIYYWLFLLPAMLRIREEIALLGALLVAAYITPIPWLGYALVLGAWIGRERLPWLAARDGHRAGPWPVAPTPGMVSGRAVIVEDS